MNKIIIIILLSIACNLLIHNNFHIYIFIGNSFTNYYELPKKTLLCKTNNIKYLCSYSKSKEIKYQASIYNGNKKFPVKPNFSYNIIITTEKLSQVRFMKNIGEGKNRYYQLAVDYRLFNNKWHISKPPYSNTYLPHFIEEARNNYGNFSQFSKRKNNIVYIQKAKYKNRQYIVNKIMKFIQVDSYGKDLNNKPWPLNISIYNKIEILKKYKFCLAIENSVITWKKNTRFVAPEINNDYVTEKLLDCLESGSIPIYFGPNSTNLFLPHPNAIINLNDFNSIESLANYIIHLNTNPVLMMPHLSWHDNISKEWYNRFHVKYSFSYCKICNRVLKYSTYNDY